MVRNEPGMLKRAAGRYHPALTGHAGVFPHAKSAFLGAAPPLVEGCIGAALKTRPCVSNGI